MIVLHQKTTSTFLFTPLLWPDQQLNCFKSPHFSSVSLSKPQEHSKYEYCFTCPILIQMGCRRTVVGPLHIQHLNWTVIQSLGIWLCCFCYIALHMNIFMLGYNMFEQILPPPQSLLFSFLFLPPVGTFIPHTFASTFMSSLHV